MTVTELKKKCDGMIADGYGDSEIILCIEDDRFYPLTAGFSSVVYNRDEVHELIEEMELTDDDVVVLN